MDLAPVTAAVEATRSKLDGDLGNMLREVRKFASDLEPKRIAEVIHSKKLEAPGGAWRGGERETGRGRETGVRIDGHGLGRAVVLCVSLQSCRIE